MKYLVIAALVAQGAMATNGTFSIGISPASKAMGGTGVGNYTNAVDANYKNPALLHSIEKPGTLTGEAYFTYLKNANSIHGIVAGTDLGEKESQSPGLFVPNLGASYKVNDEWAFAFTSVVYGGARSDFTTERSYSHIKAHATLARFALGVAYTPIPAVTIGVAPSLNYSEMALGIGLPTQKASEPHGSTTLGWSAGVAATLCPSWSMGASVVPKVKHINRNIADLGNLLNNTGAFDDLIVEDPFQVAVGTSVNVTPELKLVADYRFINWSKAHGYEVLGWQDQHVIAFGAQYQINEWKLRAGFNYGKSPIRDASGEVGTGGNDIDGNTVYNQSLTSLNLIAFPGITEKSFTVGTGYALSEAIQIDFSFLYAPEVTVTRSGTGVTYLGPAYDPTAPIPGVAYSYTAKSHQWAISTGLSYHF